MRCPVLCVTKNSFSYFSTKTNVVGTQKNRLNEMVLLSTQNKLMGKKIFYNLTLKNFVYLNCGPMKGLFDILQDF